MTPLRWFERRTGRCGSLLLAAVLLAGCVSGPALPVPMGEASPTSINAPRPTNSSGSAAANAATGGRRDLVTESDESDSARRARIRTELAAAYFGQGQYVTALDEVNSKFGRFTAVPAAQGFRREWKMRAESRSPAWTTRIDEVPVVNAL